MIDVDQTQWPMMVVTFSDRVSWDELQAYLATMDRVLANGEPYVLLARCADLKPWESKLIQRQAYWIRDQQADLRRLCRGLALVAPTLWVKGLFQAVLWIQALPYPYAVFSTADEGMAWLAERRRGAGMDAAGTVTTERASRPSAPAGR